MRASTVIRFTAAIIGTVVALTVVACGGNGGNDVEPASGIEGAEQTTRDYLTALAEGDGEAACGYFSDDWREDIITSNQAAAEQVGASDCASFIEGLHNEATISIGGEELTPELAEQIDLQTDLRADLTDGEGESATIHAEEQTYELEVIDGTWKITEA